MLHTTIVDRTIESVLAQQTDLPFEVIMVGGAESLEALKRGETSTPTTSSPCPVTAKLPLRSKGAIMVLPS